MEIEAEPDLLAAEPHQLRVLLTHKNEEAGYAGMAMSQTFNRETRVLSLMPGSSVSLAMVLIPEKLDVVRVVVQDALTGAVLSESPPIPIQIKL